MKEWCVRGVSDERGRFVEVSYPEILPAVAIQIPLDQIGKFIRMLNEAKRQAEKL